jgi:membrane protease subunit HflC
MNEKSQKSAGLLAMIAFGFMVIGSQSIFIVNEMTQALVIQFGQHQRTIREPGLHFKLPFIQDVALFDKRILNLSAPDEEVILADQKRLMVGAYLRYKIIDPLIFFQRLQTENNAQSRLNAFLQSALRSELAKNTQADILSPKRDDMMNNIQNVMNEQAVRLGIEIVDVRIRGADLPSQVTENVFGLMRSQRDQEAKLIRAEGEQQAVEIRAKADKERTIILAEGEKQAQILRGQGDEEAIRTFASAFNKDPKFYGFVRSLEAYRKTLANPETTLVMSPDNAFLRKFQQGGAE